MGKVDKLILIKNDEPGIDNLDGKLLRMVADSIATPLYHIFNLSLEESVCPQAWREARKSFRYPKRPLLILTADLFTC